MRFRSPSVACSPWFVTLMAGPALLCAAAGGCTPRALIVVDVVGDAPFQNVTLRLSAAGTSKDFAGVSFRADIPFKAGLYVDAGSNTLTVTARALNGGNCIGIGTGSATGVSAGSATVPVMITVSHSSSCTSEPPGTGGSNGGGTGGGGDGTGGSNAGVGGSNTGTGGSNTGTGGTNGGVGGSTGSGGQPAGNLIVNGDFSNGEDSWGFPAMMGGITHAVTGGALCVTLSSGTSSVTIGYPSGATPPFQITGGTAYRFSYQASTSGNVAFEAKVGQTQIPYDATGSDWPGESVGASLQTITHTFTRGSTDASMGVAFNITGGPSTVCVDNVTLTPN